jgi:ribonucleoside-triphosphate reductase
MLASTLGTVTNVVADQREGRFGTDPNYTVRIYQLTNDYYRDTWFKSDDKVWFKIEKVEEIPSSTAYCFEVEDGEPVFTVGTTGILTHNCRLKIDLRELRRRGGGLFGSGELTGSIGVVTLNLPRLAYLSSKKYDNVESAKKDFFIELEKYMNIAKESLELKRAFLEKQLEVGLFPAFKKYVGHLENHFSTIGLVGMNEMCLNLLGTGIKDDEGKQFSLEVLDFMRDKIADFQEETGNLYNLEATPAESCAFRLAKIDVGEFGEDIITQGNTNGFAPYYTNSCHLPVSEVEDILQVISHQEELQEKFTGGTVVHLYTQNSMSGDMAKHIIRTICENYKVPYVSISPVYSICPDHNFIEGNQPICPHCGKETEQYQRITGYIRQVSKFNPGKKAEFADRHQLIPKL